MNDVSMFAETAALFNLLEKRRMFNLIEQAKFAKTVHDITFVLAGAPKDDSKTGGGAVKKTEAEKQKTFIEKSVIDYIIKKVNAEEAEKKKDNAGTDEAKAYPRLQTQYLNARNILNATPEQLDAVRLLFQKPDKVDFGSVKWKAENLKRLKSADMIEEYTEKMGAIALSETGLSMYQLYAERQEKNVSSQKASKDKLKAAYGADNVNEYTNFCLSHGIQDGKFNFIININGTETRINSFSIGQKTGTNGKPDFTKKAKGFYIKSRFKKDENGKSTTEQRAPDLSEITSLAEFNAALEWNGSTPAHEGLYRFLCHCVKKLADSETLTMPE